MIRRFTQNVKYLTKISKLSIIMKKLMSLLVAVALVACMTSCAEAEQAKQDIEGSAQQAIEAVEDAGTEAIEAVEGAAQDAVEAVEGAAQEMEEAVEGE